MNQVLLKGNVGNNIKVIANDNSPTLVMFSVATNEIYVDKNGEKQYKTSWVNTKAFGKVAEEAKELKSGDFIFLDGKIRVENWLDKKTNEKHYSQSVHVNEFILLSKNNKIGLSDIPF